MIADDEGMTADDKIKFDETQRQWAMIAADEDKGRQEKLKLWAKFINHQYAAFAALFELITGFKPPKMKEVAAIISGH